MSKYCNIESMPTQYCTLFDTHLHDFFEVIIFLTDGVNLISNNQSYRTKVGDVFIFQPFSLHSVNIERIHYNRLLIHFHDKMICEDAAVLAPVINQLKNTSSNMFHLSADELDVIKKMIVDAERIQNNTHPMAEFETICSLGNIFSYLAERLGAEQETAQKRNIKKSDIERILLFINDNFDKNITVQTLCEEFNISKTRLWSIMNSTVGMSAKEYITQIRLSHAMSMLVSGVSVTETSNLCGFNSYANFIRTFTKSVGVSPYKYGKVNSR